jgi:hypothetical protein
LLLKKLHNKNLSARLKIIVYLISVFSPPDGPDSKMASGQHTLVFGIRVDTYKTLKEALNEIAASMENSNGKIKLCCKVYSID